MMNDIIKKVLAVQPKQNEQEKNKIGHYGPPASILKFPK